MRLTVAQATVRFLAAQHVERDGEERAFFAGCLGIFGHGNVAGLGQALLQEGFPYVMARNEQAMVHTAVGYARACDRLAAWACTTSVGPGATNLVTGAALATINRVPVLLLPGDVFATRTANPVLQELEDARTLDVSVNDCLKPVSKYWDRINRPEQLAPALLAAMRVLTDPAETGAVTLALPQDVQAEAHDWPDGLFARRVWHVPRPLPEPGELARALDVLTAAERPLIVAGGGVHYSGAAAELRAFAERTGFPVAETQAGKGALPWDHPQAAGAIGATGGTAANELARRADAVLGIGTRYSDFTTASRTLFARDGVRFVNLNAARFDAAKLAALPLVADAREGLRALAAVPPVGDAYRAEVRDRVARWNAVVDAAYGAGDGAQTAVIGAVNAAAGPRDVVVCAAGSMPGDLHRLWRCRDPKGYHVEYGYSCMGYEIAGGLGVRLADPSREVFVLVGDGSYLMMAAELATAAALGARLVVVLVQNHGYASIGNLSESVGAERLGTRYTGPDGRRLPVDLAANAASLGVRAVRADGVAALRDALREAREAPGTTVIEVETDPALPAPDGGAWWDVPVAGTAGRDAARDARARYEESIKSRRHHL
ncbi:3D-(3,5/4)-trihydroxycyclohexane-1,2-dione acylhydrolase (decyclizing) [Actinomadura parmotrematis]|uniref:3D-(3,5/4)-trihydroxycyclohexane-1,2-dione acylhydrolase (Decyclizing) n=1 Tax=Actinomadura parmotrematis TaxID=2864039 RepID=A0ABS7FRD3_9ACTN|nr:3D-(3,5/4)-trihydroxycyclohexane-1,2-dione acylhydrolase (decyclizing) [Actinomadura parmotrematis]MBW8482535.1 3D-(3,5/4)-trihydroxycyclohexane-1,2-dione acylhydrolase (decyclizing) [Actinomadura parmotrematis]